MESFSGQENRPSNLMSDISPMSGNFSQNNLIKACTKKATTAAMQRTGS
jgi:hypothetical protein